MFFPCRQRAGDSKYRNPEQVEKIDQQVTCLCPRQDDFIKEMILRNGTLNKMFLKGVIFCRDAC
jgi:hypothetical protein